MVVGDEIRWCRIGFLDKRKGDWKIECKGLRVLYTGMQETGAL